MSKNQLKIYVSDEEKERLELLAKLNSTNLSNYIRMTSLGVRIRPPKEIPVLVEVEVPVEKIVEKLIEVEKPSKQLDGQDKALLEEIVERSSSGNNFIRYDADFNARLITYAHKRLQEQEHSS